MLKKFFCILLMISFMISLVCAENESDATNEYSFHITDEGAVLDKWSFKCNEETQPSQIILPNMLEDIPIVGIGNNSLPNCNGKDIIIPEGVIYLEEQAFEMCGCPNTIYFPSSLKTIPEGCLMNLDADVIFPNGNQFFKVENGFLIDCRTQTLLYSTHSSIGNQLPSIFHLASWCLDNWLFYKDESELNSLVLPETLLSIGSFVFYDLPDLERITLPEGIENLSSNCFFCTGLEEINLPSSLAEIPSYCFTDCSLRSLKIPDSVSYIGEYAVFRNWDELPSVTIPSSVQFVGYYAFPEETRVIATSQATHVETFEEYLIRCPEENLP